MRIFGRRDAALGRRSTRLRTVKTVNTALTCLGTAGVLGGATSARPSLLLGGGACLLVVIINDRAQHRFFVRERGRRFAQAVVPLRLLSYLVNGMAVTVGWLLREMLGEPGPDPTVEAFAEVGLKMWPPVPAKRKVTPSGTREAK